MNKLELDQQSLLGACEIRDWLKNTINTEGRTKRLYCTIASYILSDIEDAIAITKEQVL